MRHTYVELGQNVEMKRARYLVVVAALALAVTACGDSSPGAAIDPTVLSGLESNSTAGNPPTTLPSDDGDPAQPTSTSSSSTTLSTLPPVSVPSFDVASMIDRNLSVASIVVADDDGRFLGTAIDRDGLGCEGIAPPYYVKVDGAGAVSETGSPSGERTYAGYPTASPNRRQVLDVGSCEGFLGELVLYDLAPDLGLESAIRIDTGDVSSGDATWTAEGFITMFLSADYPFGNPSDSGQDGEPDVTVFLVNPRSGERTQSGMLDQFHYGAVRLPDGRLVYTSFGSEVEVVVGSRAGEPLHQYSASSFSVSPDTRWLLVWDWVFDASEQISIELVSLDTGESQVLAAGSSLGAVWSDDSQRVAFSNGLETYVYDVSSTDMITLGGAEPEGCEDDSFVVWGRVPMAFTPSGDLYVGDAVCDESTDGYPFSEFKVHQVSFR